MHRNIRIHLIYSSDGGALLLGDFISQSLLVMIGSVLPQLLLFLSKYPSPAMPGRVFPSTNPDTTMRLLFDISPLISLLFPLSLGIDTRHCRLRTSDHSFSGKLLLVEEDKFRIPFCYLLYKCCRYYFLFFLDLLASHLCRNNNKTAHFRRPFNSFVCLSPSFGVGPPP